jgi:hypothetical protein
VPVNGPHKVRRAHSSAIAPVVRPAHVAGMTKRQSACAATNPHVSFPLNPRHVLWAELCRQSTRHIGFAIIASCFASMQALGNSSSALQGWVTYVFAAHGPALKAPPSTLPRLYPLCMLAAPVLSSHPDLALPAYAKRSPGPAPGWHHRQQSPQPSPALPC